MYEAYAVTLKVSSYVENALFKNFFDSDVNVDETVQQDKTSVQDMEKVMMKLKDDLTDVKAFQRSNVAELRNIVADLRNKNQILERHIDNLDKNQENLGNATKEIRSNIAKVKYGLKV